MKSISVNVDTIKFKLLSGTFTFTNEFKFSINTVILYIVDLEEKE